MGSAINLHKCSAGKLKAIPKVSNHSFKFWVKSDIFTIIYNRFCWKSILVNWLLLHKWDISKLDMRLTGMIRRNSIFLTGLTTPASLIQMKRCVSWNAATLPGWKDFNHCLVGWVSHEKKMQLQNIKWGWNMFGGVNVSYLEISPNSHSLEDNPGTVCSLYKCDMEIASLQCTYTEN